MIQIDIDMPKTCDDCPFHIYHSGRNYVCVATPLFYPMNLANYKGGRKDFCPLKEVSQEPFINKPCVSSGVCEHDKNKMLDNIRAEIENYKLSEDELIEMDEDSVKWGMKIACDILEKHER